MKTRATAVRTAEDVFVQAEGRTTTVERYPDMLGAPTTRPS